MHISSFRAPTAPIDVKITQILGLILKIPAYAPGAFGATGAMGELGMPAVGIFAVGAPPIFCPQLGHASKVVPGAAEIASPQFGQTDGAATEAGLKHMIASFLSSNHTIISILFAQIQAIITRPPAE